MTIRIPSPLWSLTIHRSELNHAQRWLIYLAKIAQGALIGMVFLLGYALSDHTGTLFTAHYLLSAWIGSFGVALISKISYTIADLPGVDGAINPLDWACDLSLESCWVAPFWWSVGSHLAALGFLIVFALTYWGSEE